MTDNKIPTPTEVNGFHVVSAVAITARPGEYQNQWIVICEPANPDPTTGRGYLTWLVAWSPTYNGGSYVAMEGCYELTRDEADTSLRQRTFGGRRHLQYLAKED